MAQSCEVQWVVAWSESGSLRDVLREGAVSVNICGRARVNVAFFLSDARLYSRGCASVDCQIAVDRMRLREEGGGLISIQCR